MVADGEEERSERVPLRASLGRHEDVAVAVSRLLVEEEEAARDLYHSATVGMSSGYQRRRPAKMASREMELKPFTSCRPRPARRRGRVMNKTEVTSLGKAGIIAVIESELFPW